MIPFGGVRCMVRADLELGQAMYAPLLEIAAMLRLEAAKASGRDCQKRLAKSSVALAREDWEDLPLWTGKPRWCIDF